MKDNVLFINEAFYKRYTPVARSIDDAQLTSLTRSVQVTLVIDLLSDALYDHIYDKIEIGDALTPDEDSMFTQLQLFMTHVVAKRFLSESPANGGNDTLDRAVNSINSAVKQLEAKVVKIINASTELSLIAGTSEIVEYDDSEMNSQGGFYFDGN